MKPIKGKIYERLQGKNSGSYIKVTQVHSRKKKEDSFCEIEAVYVDAWPNRPKRIRKSGQISFKNFVPSSYRQLTKAQMAALESAGTSTSISLDDVTKKIEKFSSARDQALLNAYLSTPEAHKVAKAKNIFDKVTEHGSFASRKQRGFFYRLVKDAGADLTAYGKALNTPEPGENDGEILAAIQAQNELIQAQNKKLDQILSRLTQTDAVPRNIHAKKRKLLS